MPGDYTNGLVLVARLGKNRRTVKGHPQGRLRCRQASPTLLLLKVTYSEKQIERCVRVVDELFPEKTNGPPAPEGTGGPVIQPLSGGPRRTRRRCSGSG